MAGITVDASALQQWSRLLASEVREIERRVEPAVKAQTADVARQAEAMAPHRTGALRASIQPSGGGLKRVVKAGGGRAFYARFQEFGTSKMAANPFLLRQANAENAAAFETRIARALTAGPIWR
jgi:HK97 gp10 family phage protein